MLPIVLNSQSLCFLCVAMAVPSASDGRFHVFESEKDSICCRNELARVSGEGSIQVLQPFLTPPIGHACVELDHILDFDDLELVVAVMVICGSRVFRHRQGLGIQTQLMHEGFLTLPVSLQGFQQEDSFSNSTFSFLC